MIKVSDVEVSFQGNGHFGRAFTKKKTILKKISLEVFEGECLGILGESGSGKTTLGKVICGLLKPQQGDVCVYDQSIYKGKRKGKMVKRHLAVVFQDYISSVNPRFTVGQIIGEGVLLRKKSGHFSGDATIEIIRCLKSVGLEAELMDRFAHELSGGQLQRVCIARALAVNPKVILFDEAVSSLDIHTQVQLMDLLKGLQASLGLTYIFITHDLTAITYMCSRVIFLNQGEIAEVCEVSQLHLVKSEYANQLLNAVIYLDDV